MATDCIRQEINKKVGYEASLAQIEYSVNKFGEMGLCFSFEGYSDKLLDFGALFLEYAVACAEEIDPAFVTVSLQK